MRYLTELSLEAFIEAARNVPYQQISSELFPGIDLWVRRDDLIDPLISGNKAYKLIYNLLEARAQCKHTIVTCGGAWSNHIHATAAAGQRFGFKTVGIIRGERPPVLSAMLQDAERFGMGLKFVSRSDYRLRHQRGFMGQIGISDTAQSYFIPEGGANKAGAKGVRLLGRIIGETAPGPFEECWIPCGTGLTLGALVSGLAAGVNVIGVAVLKAETGIKLEAKKWVPRNSSNDTHSLLSNCHHGGYGKRSKALIAFQQEYESSTGLPIDHVYMAKLLFALKNHRQAAHQKTNTRQSKVLFIHTGGLQGKRGA